MVTVMTKCLCIQSMVVWSLLLACFQRVKFVHFSERFTQCVTWTMLNCGFTFEKYPQGRLRKAKRVLWPMKPEPLISRSIPFCLQYCKQGVLWPWHSALPFHLFIKFGWKWMKTVEKVIFVLRTKGPKFSSILLYDRMFPRYCTF